MEGPLFVFMPDFIPPQPAGMTYDEMGLGRIGPSEVWWREHYSWLLEQGYKLRERYKPDWVPSWKGQDSDEAVHREDGQPSARPSVLDAIRIKDGAHVALKRIRAGYSAAEIGNTSFLNFERLPSPEKNHTVPVYDVLSRTTGDPQYDLMAIPVLRSLWDTPFITVGEVVGCVRQLIEGLDFIHQQRMVHRDCHPGNIMMDALPMYPEGFHFTSSRRRDMNRDWSAESRPLSRTECSTAVRYFFIDFGLSIHFDDEGPTLATPAFGGDRTVPEFRGDGIKQQYDPFPTDVYYLGNSLRQIFLDGVTPVSSGYRGLEFLRPLLAEMMHEDPTKRPKMTEVALKFESLVSGLNQLNLRSPLSSKDEFIIFSFFYSFARWKQVYMHWRRGLPAIPKATDTP